MSSTDAKRVRMTMRVRSAPTGSNVTLPDVTGMSATGTPSASANPSSNSSSRGGSTVATRRLGMWLFSMLVKAFTRRRIYDTSSGFRIFSRQAFALVGDQPFLDFHAETIVLLLRAGYKVGEEWIVANERRAGTSMYNALSAVKYPLKTSLLVLLAFLGSGMTNRK